MNFKIDNLQYCNWSRKIFEYNRSAGLDAVHVTIVYHEDYDELLEEVKKWEILFSENSDLIFLGKDYKDIEKANSEITGLYPFVRQSLVKEKFSDLKLINTEEDIGSEALRKSKLSYRPEYLLEK